MGDNKLKVKNEKLRIEKADAADNAAPRDIQGRTFAFALRIIRLCRKVTERPGVGRTLANQLFRAGTAIGANIEEAQAAQSRADFISKANIALKEARETLYWLRLLAEAEVVPQRLLVEITNEADQLTKILGAIVRTSRRSIP
jgi:four helix bundle protein